MLLNIDKRFLPAYALVFFGLPCLLASGAWAQDPKEEKKNAKTITIAGTVFDEFGELLVGAAVVEKGTTNGTLTDTNGSYEFQALHDATLVFSFVGYTVIEEEVAGRKTIDVSMQPDISSMEAVVVTGSRGKMRTVLESPVPIDNISAASLAQSGQYNVEQMLNYRVPSYNSTNQTVSDATAHFDPSELRNLGPSRTLVLVNGKRKNQSALVYINDTPGKGEVGVDLKSIPAEAIKRIEVLRDGATALYGSDAIAGVINIVLKEDTVGQASASAGVTTEGDGFANEVSVYKGFKLPNDISLHVTGDFYYQSYTNRAGTPGNNADIAQTESVLFNNGKPLAQSSLTWIQQNPRLGSIIGQPQYAKSSIMVNSTMPYQDGDSEAYFFGGYTYRGGKSFALYRTPYWIKNDFGLLTPVGQAYTGFLPTFETGIHDYSFTLGTKNTFGEWHTDASYTMGGNRVNYTGGNTINPALRSQSPTRFRGGGYSFDHIVGNIDVTRVIDNFSIYFGTEARREQFQVTAGQSASYENKGAQSFPGLQPQSALKRSRANVGVYAGLDWDATADFLVGGTARYEYYTDFGSNFSWKFNARHLFDSGNGTVRASVSTGFRAPSLHQIYLSNVQTLVAAGTVSNQGTFNHESSAIKSLGIPSLKAETSLNFTAGAAYKLTDQFSMSADYYNITLNNRILFTGAIGADNDTTKVNPVEKILNDNNITTLKFFVNALNTRTQGVDFVADYTDIKFGEWTLDLTASFNYNKTTILSVIAPGIVGEQGYDIFDRKEQARVTTARPNVKFLVGMSFNYKKLTTTLNNTYFGEVTWRHATDPNKDQTFAPRAITDLIMSYGFSKRFSANLTVNNLFNIYPEEIDPKGATATNLGGRFRYPWEVNQFGFNGAFIKAGVRYTF